MMDSFFLSLPQVFLSTCLCNSVTFVVYLYLPFCSISFYIHSTVSAVLGKNIARFVHHLQMKGHTKNRKSTLKKKGCKHLKCCFCHHYVTFFCMYPICVLSDIIVHCLCKNGNSVFYNKSRRAHVR